MATASKLNTHSKIHHVKPLCSQRLRLAPPSARQAEDKIARRSGRLPAAIHFWMMGLTFLMIVVSFVDFARNRRGD